MRNQTEIRFTLFPFVAWFVGVLFLGGAVFNYTKEGFSMGTLVAGVTGLVCLFLPGILFITADRTDRILSIELLSLTLIGSTKKIRFEEIAALRLEKQRFSRKRSTNRKKLYAYRIVIVRKDGEIIPFRAAFESGTGEKQKDMVQQLSAFIDCAVEIPSLSEYED